MCIRYKVALICISVNKTLVYDHSNESDQYFHVVLSIMLYKLALGFRYAE